MYVPVISTNSVPSLHVTDQQENIQGLGLPEFMNPGPPPGQPLLNADDFQNLDNFFHDFDSNALAASKQNDHPQYGLHPDQQNYFNNMPPMFVGSETALGQRPSLTPNHLQTPTFPYGDVMMGHGLPVLNHNNAINHGLQGHSYPSFPTPVLPQYHNTASVIQSHNQPWAPDYPNPNMMSLQYPPRPPVVSFGTDNRFQASGYVAPNAPADPDMINPFHPMEILEPASGSTTQPNTQPNTQPSSPTWSKKRTFDDFHQDQRQNNGFLPPSKAQLASPATSSPPKPASRPARGLQAKSESKRPSKPPTPSTASKPRPTLDTEQDAEAEDDDDDATADQDRSPSPTSWPSGARPPRVTKPPPQPAKSTRRKKSLGTSTPIKPKAKAQRTSSVSQSAQAARTPLSLEQKKANHTSSEQRRRDATARAYAELYDLVPELEELGKQSTMKKLEVVVDKVRRVKQQVEELSIRLGIDPSARGQLATSVNDDLVHNGVTNWS